MNTFTLELPEDLSERLSLLPEDDRNRYVIAYLRAGMDLLAPVTADRDFNEAVEGIRAGFADMDANRTIDADDFFDRFPATRRQ